MDAELPLRDLLAAEVGGLLRSPRCWSNHWIAFHVTEIKSFRPKTIKFNNGSSSYVVSITGPSDERRRRARR